MVDAEPWFADTNVLIYAFDAREPAKQRLALQLLSDGRDGLVISAQVLGEFFYNATRKLGMTTEQARVEVTRLSPKAKVSVDAGLVGKAIELCGAKSLSYWDALIVAAAARYGCSRLLTEDLNAGEVIAGVQIVNPFSGL